MKGNFVRCTSRRGWQHAGTGRQHIVRAFMHIDRPAPPSTWIRIHRIMVFTVIPITVCCAHSSWRVAHHAPVSALGLCLPAFLLFTIDDPQTYYGAVDGTCIERPTPRRARCLVLCCELITVARFCMKAHQILAAMLSRSEFEPREHNCDLV